MLSYNYIFGANVRIDINVVIVMAAYAAISMTPPKILTFPLETSCIHKAALCTYFGRNTFRRIICPLVTVKIISLNIFRKQYSRMRSFLNPRD